MKSKEKAEEASMSLRCKMWKLLRDRRGGVAVIFGLSLFPLAAGVGSAVDYGRATAERVKLQQGLDLAALALVKEIDTTSDAGAASKARTMLAPRLSDFDRITGLTARYDKEAGTLTLAATADVETSFMKVFSFDKLRIAAAATAKVVSELGACVIALHPTQKHSFQTKGNGAVEVPNCGIFANSNHKDAFDQGGSSWIRAKWLGSVGGYRGSNYSPLPLTGRSAIADPLAKVPEPVAPSTCTYNGETLSGNITFPGGTVFCGKISFAGNITFGPGIHYFRNAQASIGSSFAIQGTEAMLYFDGASNFSSSSTGVVDLTAPQSGPYAGIALFGSRSSTQLFKITGNKDYFVDGTIYLPTAALEMYGSADLNVTSRSGYVIASTFMYSGNSTFRFDAYGGAVPKGMTGNFEVTLVR
jgi:Flp pilus assembly protein TadG